MFQPVKNFLAQLREQFRVFLPPFSGYGCIAGLPVLQRALADGIILDTAIENRRSPWKDCSIRVCQPSNWLITRATESWFPFVAHVLRRAVLAQLVRPDSF